MLIRLRYAVMGVVIAAFGAGVPAALPTGAVQVGYDQSSRPGASAAMTGGASGAGRATPFGAFVLSSPGRLIVPDLAAVRPGGLTAAQVSEIGGLAGARAVLAVDGGRVVINGQAASVLGVPPGAFRSWTRPRRRRPPGPGPGWPTGSSSRTRPPWAGSGFCPARAARVGGRCS